MQLQLSKMINNNSLQRFVDAQKNLYSIALAEIKEGKKQSHWMWFIFPQIKGLGSSNMSAFYGIKNIDEANEFLQHPILGARLIEICNVLLGLKNKNATAIFGKPDDIKLKSCMTLFSLIKNTDPVFEKVLMKFFNNEKDIQTINIVINK